MVGIIKWYASKVENLKKLSNLELFLFISSKSLGGMAMGMIIASYVKDVNWFPIGISLFVVAILLGIPSLKTILR